MVCVEFSSERLGSYLHKVSFLRFRSLPLEYCLLTGRREIIKQLFSLIIFRGLLVHRLVVRAQSTRLIEIAVSAITPKVSPEVILIRIHQLDSVLGHAILVA